MCFAYMAVAYIHHFASAHFENWTWLISFSCHLAWEKNIIAELSFTEKIFSTELSHSYHLAWEKNSLLNCHVESSPLNRAWYMQKRAIEIQRAKRV